MREGGAKDGPSFGLISVTMLKYHDRKQFGKKGVYFGLWAIIVGKSGTIVTLNSHITSTIKSREELTRVYSLACLLAC